MKTYLRMADCPFRPGDRVVCDYTNGKGTVDRIEDEVVFVVADTGACYYRTWSHDLDTIMHKSGGGLTREQRPEAPYTTSG